MNAEKSMGFFQSKHNAAGRQDTAVQSLLRPPKIPERQR